MERMNLLSDKTKCCGCGLCVHICPKKSIRLVEDEFGFFYPSIDDNSCINCGLCLKECLLKNAPQLSSPLKMLVAKDKDVGELMGSTSGGMYSVISNYVLENNGVVYAPVFSETMHLRHDRITDKTSRDHSRGSKYIQSELTVFDDVMRDSNEGKRIAFFGTPCQVESIKKFLEMKKVTTDRLLLIDVVCNGVGSNVVFREQLNRISRKFHKAIVDYKFRTKKEGRNAAEELVVFDDGSMVVLSEYQQRINPWYHSRLTIRPSCGECRYCSIKRCSDITIGDYSRDDTKIDIDRNGGISTLLLNTEKGVQLFHEVCSKIDSQEMSYDEITQIRLRVPEAVNPKQSVFISNVKHRGLDRAINSYLGPIKRLKLLLYHFKNGKR